MIRRVSEPVQGGSFELEYRQREPLPQSPDSLLVLLHGVGGNETQLSVLADTLPESTLVLFARAPRPFGPAGYRWFDVEFTAGGPKIAKEEADSSRLQLIRFVQQVQGIYGIRPERTLIAGFSQGGIMSAGVALTRPDVVGGFGLLAGRILPEIAANIPVGSDALKRLDGFIAHGEADGKLPVSLARQSSETLTALGVPHRLWTYPVGHTFDEAMQEDFVAWVQQCFGARGESHVAGIFSTQH